MRSNGNASKQNLMNTALALFSQKGFDQVTIKDICEKAGCSNGTFYYHFGSMNGLLEELRETSSVINTEVLTEVLALPTPWQKLWHIHEQFVHIALSFGPTLYFPLFMKNANEDASPFSMDEITRIITPLIRQGQEQGEILNISPAVDLSHTVGLTMIGVLYYWHRNADAVDLKKSMRHELEIVYNLREDLREKKEE